MINNNPPFDGGAERLCLGAMLLLPETAPAWENVVRPEDFFVPKHRAVARAVAELRARGSVHDVVAVSNYFVAQSNGTSNPIAVSSSEIVEITEDALYLGDRAFDELPRHAERVRVLSVVREMRTLAQLVAVEAATISQDAERWLDSVTQRVMAITQRAPRSEKATDVDSLTKKTVELLVTGGVPSGVAMPASLGKLRALWGRLQPKLYFVAARPGVGKTSLIYQIAHEVARSGAGIVVNLSYEMEEEELILRELAARCGRSVDEIDVSPDGTRTRFANEVQEAGAAMRRELASVIDYCPELPVEQVKSRIRRRHWEAQRVYGNKPLALVTLDYLQLMRPAHDRGNTNANLEHITRELALLAGELRVPVLCGCQLNRESAKRGDKPALNDLRGSGAIEQDAHGVVFLHRDEKNEDEGETEVIVAKQRRSPKGTAYLNFNGRTTSFLPSDKWPITRGGSVITSAEAAEDLGAGSFQEGPTVEWIDSI